ncbi:MAG: nuclear transport factor 2 family protein [Sandaracinaceae bacterium]|nr:nuclear transport factor 2 family protein [Sandaracinaceae bacterium]
MRAPLPLLALVFGLAGCGAAQRPSADDAAAVGRALDEWHAAAAASDAPRYFAAFTDDAIFLGTDATERWTVAELRAYAERPFAQGRGWVMRAVRRDVVVEGELAWFDEDLEAVNLGPARGSGVLRREGGRWRIAHYNLAITVPNERFAAVRALLGEAPQPAAETSGETSITTE